jgi:SSS family solute:Na+ symporter
MKSFGVGLSLFATMLSVLTYLALPGEMIKHGPVILWVLAGLPIVYLVTGYLLIPHIMRLPVTSAYEILEARLGLFNRLLGSAIFLAIRLIWMAVVIYVTADKVFVVVMGWDKSVTPYVCAVLGLVTVVYTSMGGLRAVVFTDALQSIILFGGALLTLVIITIKLGGVGAWWPHEWAPTWDAQPVFSLDPHVRVTVVGTIVMFSLWWVCTAGSDQMAIQRHLATRDAAAARRAFLITMVSNGLVFILLGLVGFALLGFFRAGAGDAAAAASIREKADLLFPRFIVSHLPVGVAGLIISGLLAAAMSSLSSGVNSSCSVLVIDIAKQFERRPRSDAERARLAKRMAFVVGAIAVVLSSFMGYVSGNLFEVVQKTANLFTTPLFGLFFMAMFVRWATPYGAAFGSLYGAAVAVLIGFWDAITGQPAITFQWIIPVSLAVNIVAGCGWSLLPTRGRPPRWLLFWSCVASVPLVAVFALVLRA